jgi:hypothetical protein
MLERIAAWIASWIASWPGAVLLQESGTAYLFVNAAHIVGIALLIGAILPLDLRLLGLFRTVPVAVIGPFLSRTAAVGVTWAVLTGLWLFSVKPAEYLVNPAFLTKMALLAFAIGNIALQHHGRHFRLALEGGKIQPRVRILAAFSALLWLSVLVAGRWIGFL